MTTPTAFLTLSDADTRARRAFWRGFFAGWLTLGALLVGGAWFAAAGGM